MQTGSAGAQQDPPPAAHAAAAPTAGTLVGRAVSVWWRNVGRFSVLTLISYVPVLLGSFAAGAIAAWQPRGAGGTPDLFSGPPLQFLVAGTLGTFLMLLVEMGALTHGTIQHLAGRPVRIGAMLGAGFRRLFPLVGVGLLVALVVGAGMALLVVPGVVLACALVAAVPSIVVERCGVVGALRRSFALTRGSRVTVFAAGLSVWALGMLVNVVASGLLPAVFRGPGALLGGVVLVVFSTLPVIVPAVAYHDLRVAKEGVDTSELAKVFE